MKHRTFLLGLILLAFGGSARAQEQSPNKVYMVSNAHFDSQWNWDVQQSISEYIPKTLNQNLFLLSKYPGYIFNFEGGIKYQWMKEYYPHQYELMKEYIRQGRWHVTGSSWDATDPNIPSTESFTRNILYGQHFYRDEFGVEGTDIFLPDCFGFGWTLPTVASHCGLIGFSTQKLMWRQHPFYKNGSKIPFEIGLWQGIDGSRIMAVMDAHNYTTAWRYEDLSQHKGLIGMASASPLKTIYHYYGTGDTGGAPTIESVRALEASLNGSGPLKIISATSDQLYKDYLPFDQHPELPVWNDELLMDVHATGCYTSQAAMKFYNRRNEQLADAAERSAVAADWLGAVAYPHGTLTGAWKRFIWHQFHDDLTGTSIPRAYEFSWNDELLSLQEFSNVLTSSVGGVSRALNTDVKGTPLVIYNATGFPVTEVVEATIPAGSERVSVYNDKGSRIPHQVLGFENGSLRILFSACVPATGYAVYEVRQGGSPKGSSALKASERSIENSIYRVSLDANGDIRSIVDKRNGRELVREGKSIRLALFTKNESVNWPAWEITKQTIDGEPVAVSGNVKISVAEQGPVRASICVERTHGDSKFRQYITLTEGGQDDRIDIRNEVDWASTNALLKAEFPLSVSNPKATYDLGVGSVARGNNTETAYEVYAQQWADLTDTDGSYGVSVLNDCKYGWDKPNDHTIRLTLLHTPKTGGGFSYQDHQDFGHHTFTYSIVGHEGDFRDGRAVSKAEMLNKPLTAFVAEKHRGSLGRSFSFASTQNDNVVLRALKRAEKSEDYIVRFYETSGQAPQEAVVTFAGNIVSARELNGVEDEIGDASFSGNRLTFTIKPFSIKTFKVRLAAPEQKAAPIVSTPVALPFDMKTASYNPYRSDANFDGKGNSYAAELFPTTLDFKGVRFEFGSAEGPNGVKCNRDTIALPEGNYNKLYIVAASTRRDNEAVFTVDGKEYPALVPYYSGFIGQWGHTDHTAGYLKGADVIFCGTHTHDMIANKDVPYRFTYMFCTAIDIPAGARELVLPDDPRIVVFAVTAAEDHTNTIAPAQDLLRVSLPITGVDERALFTRNLTLGKPVAERSGENNASERAELALDDNLATKWCDVSDASPKYLAVDLGSEQTVHGWTVMHASMESLDYTTKAYSLQVRTTPDEEWKTVDTVSDNTEMETDRLLSKPVQARYVRLLVTKPDQRGGNTVRIYEFSVY